MGRLIAFCAFQERSQHMATVDAVWQHAPTHSSLLSLPVSGSDCVSPRTDPRTLFINT